MQQLSGGHREADPVPMSDHGTLPVASVADSLAVAADVLLPNLAKGPVLRRARVEAGAERLQADRRGVRRLQRLRERYGIGPLMLRVPGQRAQAVILAPEHVHRVLEETPEPFAAASRERVAALEHFQPHGVLISHGAERTERRRYNEAVLDHDCPRHRLAERFTRAIEEEGEAIVARAQETGTLDWPTFAAGWFRVVRRVVFGDVARDDEELRAMVDELRSHGSWAALHSRDEALRERFLARVEEHTARAEPGSLAAVMATTPATARTMPLEQVPQWLFAFDPAGMAAFRTLALVVAPPATAARVWEEIEVAESVRAHLPYTRACVLESLRLWPTTPMVLRQTTAETTWETGTMPADTGVLIYTPFFHRDDLRLPFADTLAPELWLRERTRDDWPLIPFSGGPAICPGRHLVLLTASTMVATLLSRGRPRVAAPALLDPARPLPTTLNHVGLRFAV